MQLVIPLISFVLICILLIVIVKRPVESFENELPIGIFQTPSIRSNNKRATNFVTGKPTDVNESRAASFSFSKPINKNALLAPKAPEPQAPVQQTPVPPAPVQQTPVPKAPVPKAPVLKARGPKAPVTPAPKPAPKPVPQPAPAPIAPVPQQAPQSQAPVPTAQTAQKRIQDAQADLIARAVQQAQQAPTVVTPTAKASGAPLGKSKAAKK
jgi:outer membrane biosynthesis protein TonB